MNPASIFKASLGTAAGTASPLGGAYASPFSTPATVLGSGGSATPKSTYTASLVPSTSPAPAAQPTTPAGGNPSATAPVTPKQAFITGLTPGFTYTPAQAAADGQTSSSSAGTPTNTTPTNTTPVNPNYSFQVPGATTPPGSIDPSTPQGQYQLAFQTYLQSLQPSAADLDAEKALDAQTLQAQENQDTALNRPGQTTAFATGEAARVAKNDAFQTDALTNEVNALDKQQSTNETAAQAAVTNAENVLSANTKSDTPISVSPGATLYDPNTGQPIYTAPTTASQNSSGGSSGDVSQLAPYAAQTSTGVNYVDLSHVSATSRDALAQIAAQNGYQVITNTNEAADLTNITNANSDIQTIQDTLAGLTSPNAISRIANDLGVNPVAVGLQTDAQKAASATLQDAGLDLFKAISGVQGFRGNASILAQIKDNLPTIYDTSDTAAAKLSIVQQLIANREAAIVGSPTTQASTSNAASDPTQDPDYQAYLQAIGQ